MSQKLQPITSILTRTFNAHQTTLPHPCPQCSFLLPHHGLSNPPRRTLTGTPILKKQGHKPKPTLERPPVNCTPIDDPLDFTDLEADITRVLDSLKNEITRIRVGGRNPDIIESLRVHLIKGSKESERLGDLAQVIPRGREILVVVGEQNVPSPLSPPSVYLTKEAQHTKPITSSLLSSPHSINPTPSVSNPLELHIPIPAPTRESRQQSANEVAKAGEKSLLMLKGARESQKKRFKGMRMARKIGPDLLRRAEKRMEEVSGKGGGEVRRLVEGARRVLIGG